MVGRHKRSDGTGKGNPSAETRDTDKHGVTNTIVPRLNDRRPDPVGPSEGGGGRTVTGQGNPIRSESHQTGVRAPSLTSLL